MNGISITAWVIFWANIVATLSVAATSRFQSRPKAEPTHWAGIRVGATMKSSEAWRAAHPAAFRWSRLDVIGVCGAALICLLLLPARWLAWRSALSSPAASSRSDSTHGTPSRRPRKSFRGIVSTSVEGVEMKRCEEARR